MPIDRVAFISASDRLSPPVQETRVTRQSCHLLFDLFDSEAEEIIYFLRQHESEAFCVPDLADRLGIPAVIVRRNLAVVRQAERGQPRNVLPESVCAFPIRCVTKNGTTYYAWCGQN